MANEIDSASVEQASEQMTDMAKSWLWFLVIGIIMLGGGILALYRPFAASITVELITGWTFIVVGVFQVIQGFRQKKGVNLAWMLLLGILAILLGISLLANPLAGLMSLTLMIAILIGLSGIFKLIYAFRVKPAREWTWLLLSGIISIILAILILLNFFEAALVALGILLAVELISSGVMMIILGVALKKLR